MPVRIDVTTVGTYRRNLLNKKCEPGGLPRRLNENPKLYQAKTFRKQKMDLSLGCEDFQDLGFGDRLQTLFDYLQKTSPRGTCLKQKIKADFISNRRNLRRIAMSSYGKVEQVDIQAIRQNDIIFLCEKTSRKADKRPYPYGYKFEQNMTLDENGKPHDIHAPVSNSESVKAVLRTTLSFERKQLKLFYAAEVDAIDSKGQLVEMKTTAMKPDEWRERVGLRCYIQCLLSNIPYVVIGTNCFIKRSPYIFKVEKKLTNSIPSSTVSWNAEECFETLFLTLQFVKEKLQNDGDAMLIKIRSNGIEFADEDAEECTFLSKQFLSHFV